MSVIPIHTIIVDDQLSSIETLCKGLQIYPEIKIIEATTLLKKAKKAVIQQQASLLFLNVEMPGQNSLEFLKEISPYIHLDMCVVFYSAFNRYMIDALRVSAFDFLLKPFHPEELDYIISRVKERILLRKRNFKDHKFQLPDTDKKFAVHTLTNLLLLNRMEILYFEYHHKLRCWQLTHTNFSMYRLQSNTTSKDILAMSRSFVQVNRDCIINIEYLSSITNKTYRCVLYPPFENIEIYTSRRYYSQIRDMLDVL